MADELALPKWVVTCNGRIEPFEPDRVAERLFDAASQSGQSDPLVSRELAQGVFHLIVLQQFSARIGDIELGELIQKFVRELGHPEIAQFLQCKPDYERPDRRHEPWPTDVSAAIASELLRPLDGDCRSCFTGGIVRPVRAGRQSDPGW